MMMVRMRHAEMVKGRRRKITAAAVFVKLFKVSTKLIAESRESLKLLIIKAGGQALCVIISVGLYLAEQFASLVTERNMRNSLVIFVGSADDKSLIIELAHHFRKGGRANIKKLCELVGCDPLMLIEQRQQPASSV